MILAAYAALTIISCSRGTPQFVPPKVAVVDERATETCIRYRQLSRADFRSPVPPEESRLHGMKINAHTGLVLQLVDGARIIIEEQPARVAGRKSYRVHAKDIRFEALMVPERSWWNPAIPDKQKGYVLQHEQIHFAIMELWARELNEEIGRLAGSFDVVTTSPDSAKKEMQNKIDNLLAWANRQSLAEHADFDSQTSGKFNPAAQKVWLKKLTERIAKL